MYDADGGFTYNLRFPGQYFDAETGKHYNYFRDYDPAIGRYLQSDPIGMRAGNNTYGYVKARPLTRLDPLGLAGKGGAGASRKPQDVSIFGCVLGCVSAPLNRPGPAQGSLQPSIGGGIEICDRAPPPMSCPVPNNKGDCGPYDPNCDNNFEWPGPPLPYKFGVVVGASIKRDGRICVRLGLFIDAPFPSYELGDMYER